MARALAYSLIRNGEDISGRRPQCGDALLGGWPSQLHTAGPRQCPRDPSGRRRRHCLDRHVQRVFACWLKGPRRLIAQPLDLPWQQASEVLRGENLHVDRDANVWISTPSALYRRRPNADVRSHRE